MWALKITFLFLQPPCKLTLCGSTTSSKIHDLYVKSASNRTIVTKSASCSIYWFNIYPKSKPDNFGHTPLSDIDTETYQNALERKRRRAEEREKKKAERKKKAVERWQLKWSRGGRKEDTSQTTLYRNICYQELKRNMVHNTVRVLQISVPFALGTTLMNYRQTEHHSRAAFNVL